jgi:hypothetical protein
LRKSGETNGKAVAITSEKSQFRVDFAHPAIALRWRRIFPSRYSEMGDGNILLCHFLPMQAAQTG